MILVSWALLLSCFFRRFTPQRRPTRCDNLNCTVRYGTVQYITSSSYRIAGLVGWLDGWLLLVPVCAGSYRTYFIPYVPVATGTGTGTISRSLFLEFSFLEFPNETFH